MTGWEGKKGENRWDRELVGERMIERERKRERDVEEMRETG